MAPGKASLASVDIFRRPEVIEMAALLGWCVAALALVVGLWLSLMNWAVFWALYVRRVRAPSWTPLLGGLLISIAMLSAPLPYLHRWAFVPLLLDWGCLPGLAYTLWFHLGRTRRK